MNIVMESFHEGFNATKHTPITEGWGSILISIAELIPVGATQVAGIAARQISGDFLNQAMKDKELTKYIKNECDKILKAEKANDKSVTKKMPSGFMNAFKRWWHSDDETGVFSWTRMAHYKSNYNDDLNYHIDIDGYNITFFYDSNHIDAAVVVLYSEEKKAFFGKRINAPEKADLAKSFHKE